MTEQHHPQPVQGSTARARTSGLSANEELDQRWVEFSQARASLGEVMSDDELRAFGINVHVLDERP